MAGPTYDLQTVQKKSAQEALAELKRQGITSLEDLVKKGMADLTSAGMTEAAAKTKTEDTFIYRCFIYTCTSK